jgi:hypothetical protein
MNRIHGQSRQQLEFGCLEDSISRENSVRVMDAFVDKLDLSKLGFVQREERNIIYLTVAEYEEASALGTERWVEGGRLQFCIDVFRLSQSSLLWLNLKTLVNKSPFLADYFPIFTSP